MTVIYATINDQVLAATRMPRVSCNNQNSVKLHVDFDTNWSGYAKSAVFSTSKDHTVYEVILSADGECLVPAEVLIEEATLYIGVRGVKTASGEFKSSTLVKYKVLPGTPSMVMGDPTPNVYQQLLAENIILKERLAGVETGSTAEGSEVADIRIGADFLTYPTAGDAVREQIANTIIGANRVTSFNTTSGYYVEYNTGLQGNNANYSYITLAVRNGEKYYISKKNNVHVALFNGERDASNFVVGYLNQQYVTIPNGVVLMTVSVRTEDISSLEIFCKITGEQIFDGEITAEKLSPALQMTVKKNITVGPEGDYKSILRALVENQNTPIRLLVKSGVYNVAEEYIEYYGSNYFEKYNGYAGTGNPFDAGLYLRDGCEIIGIGQVNIVFRYGGNNENVKKYFSVLNTTQNNVVDNINLTISDGSCRYIVHDDFATAGGTNHFKNCTFDGSSHLTTSMGCGMGTNNTYIIENCSFFNNTGICIAYHNNVASGKNKLIVRNCYCSGSIRGAHYGVSTEKSQMYVSGCRASRVFVVYGDEANYPHQNIQLIAWNNSYTN